MSDIRFGILLSLKDSVSNGVKKVSTNLSGMKQAATDAVSKLNKMDAALSAIGGTMIAAKSIQLFKDLIGPAMEFEQTVSQIRTRLNEVGTTSDDISKKVLELSMAFGSDAQTQARGFFQALDDGAQSSADAMTILTSSNKLAKAAVVDFGTSTKAIQDVLNAYGKSADQASHIAEVFLKTDIAGANLGLGEISSFMQRINPIATELGASFEEVAASVATMTSKGVNARQAFNSVGFALSALQSHEKELSPFLKAIGEDSLESAIQTYGFTEVLDALVKTTKGNKEELEKFGLSGKMFNNVMKTLGENAKDLKKNLSDMATDTGVLDDKFKEATDNSKERWNKMKAAIEATREEIGNKLLAALEPVITKMMEWAQILQVWIKEHPNVASAIAIFSGAMAALGVAIGFVAVMAGVLMFLLAPLGILLLKVIAVIAAVVAVFYLAKAAIQAFAASNHPVVMRIKKAWSDTVQYLKDLWLVFKTDILPVIKSIGDAVSSMCTAVGNAFAAMFNWVGDKIKQFMDWIEAMKQKILEFINSVPELKMIMDVTMAIKGGVDKAADAGLKDLGSHFKMGSILDAMPMGQFFKSENISGRAGQIRKADEYYNTHLNTDPQYSLGPQEQKIMLDSSNLPPQVYMPADVILDNKVIGEIQLKNLESLTSRGVTR